jgi:hypothetical protein
LKEFNETAFGGCFISHNLAIFFRQNREIKYKLLVYMLFHYFVGLFLGINIGKAHERAHNSHYYFHTEKITKLENKIREYERLFGKTE